MMLIADADGAVWLGKLGDLPMSMLMEMSYDDKAFDWQLKSSSIQSPEHRNGSPVMRLSRLPKGGSLNSSSSDIVKQQVNSTSNSQIPEMSGGKC